MGGQLLWEAAGLLQDHDSRAVSADLIVRERLMLQLAHQIARMTEILTVDDRTASPGTPRRVRPPAAATTWCTSPEKESPMPESAVPAPHTADVFLLFAHEPYYPGPGTREINTTVVAAASLLHPHLRQPDGVRVHDLLTRGRRPGEIVPLATLTHELDGGARWPQVGDWETVTTDLVGLVREGLCDALSLGLSDVPRALLCTAPDGRVRAYDAVTDTFLAYGPDERAAVLVEVGRFLEALTAEQPLWPGDGLLTPVSRRT
ncbi:hypothetical protein [Streptomyces sp. NPDC093094]|uniref:hypothetical protein n=1 Tax=Streptomyces sp. NPDC093094 TaxID=3366026 RepID=UPI0037F52879